MVEVDAAAGAQALTIGRAEGFRVHLKDKRSASHFAQVHLIVFQQHDLLIVVGLPFLCQHTLVCNGLILGKGFRTAVTDAVERRTRLERTQQVPALFLIRPSTVTGRDTG